MAGEFSTQEVAERLGVSQRAVQEYYKRGHFPNAHKLDPTRVNSPLRIPEEDLLRFEELRKVVVQVVVHGLEDDDPGEGGMAQSLGNDVAWVEQGRLVQDPRAPYEVVKS